jgi:hypothetical protein
LAVVPHAKPLIAPFLNTRPAASMQNTKRINGYNLYSAASRSNPNARYFRLAAERYFAQELKKSHAQDRLLSLSLADQIEYTEPSQGIIAVPVHVAERTLGRYLETLIPAFRSEPFNICVLVNATQDQCSEAEFSESCEYNREVARTWNLRMRREYINVLGVHLSGPTLMGRVRRILTDSVVAYSLSKGIADPVILCNDVDQADTSKTYLSDILSSFRAKERPVFVAAPVGYGYIGDLSLGLPSRVDLPELYLFNKIQDAINHCTRKGLIGNGPRIWPEGANMAFSAAAYCDAGGFDPDRPSGEDDEMGRSLHSLASSEPLRPECRPRDTIGWRAEKFVESAWIVTDPRRILCAILAGRTGMEAWAWQRFGEHLGAKMDTPTMAQKCADAPHLLGKQHLEKLVPHRRDDVWEFVTDRVGWNFFRSIIFDFRTRNFSQLIKVAETFGLEVTDGMLDGESGDFHATIDWDRSRILEDLIRVFGSAGPHQGAATKTSL